MPVTMKSMKSGELVQISITGHFDASMHEEFQNACHSVTTQHAKCRVDLANVTYIDSYALGMLIMLQEHIESLSGEVTIYRPSDSVKKILKISKFDELMHVESLL